ncbi:glucosaminidase domain-containing protein [Enterococcus durans]|uniref:Peptidoglycan hydrolase n=2 Tax=Enterococcus durans TaxID=53345 RepID=A0AB36S744_9ENTE|nr:glucosaminidase domain-containing protein [Enterococcus durans]EOT35403.1 N-acetylmuramoyl-L-alanine amidase [Enterococcus durans ATCC 6056]EOU19356.1 N-acetylmuramoyl-L-alanine amidase [Enterococcus durans ATCC 6056]PEH44611.1 N-acetylmuramoyl-L-alanine amidase [Enterococcus durans]QPQ28378.1 glucosaminidase domain-containing protein [Enterococcus durans]QXB37650.1 glucosaminidase domain-containing protein [Enterococcus durans]
MQELKTRSARHQKSKRTLVINKKAIAPLVGTTLLVGPMMVTAAPQHVRADEQAPQNTTDPQAFINQIGWSASEVAASNDLYASVMIAQALLESAYGTSGLSSASNYNLFGVKGSYGGQVVYMATQEYIDGQWVTMNEPFRKYSSYWESFQDHANVLRSTSFSTGDYHYSGVWKSNTTSFYDATAYLTGRYATDPDYGTKLNSLINTYNLTRFDTPSTGSTSSSTSTTTTTSTTKTTTTSSKSTASSGGTYTVVSGDTLWDIAQKYGMSVDDLMAKNGMSMSNYSLLVGQELNV